jgi:hypothetical protein
MLNSYYASGNNQNIRGLSSKDLEKWTGAKGFDLFEEESLQKICLPPDGFTKIELKHFIMKKLSEAVVDGDYLKESAYKQRLVDLELEGKDEEYNKKFFSEWIAFLTGKTDKNSLEYRTIQETPSGPFVTSDTDYQHGWKIDEQPPNRRPDKTGEEIRTYLQTFTKRHYDFISKIIKLKLLGPSTLEEHWLFFKYIVKGTAKEFGTRPFPELFIDYNDFMDPANNYVAFSDKTNQGFDGYSKFIQHDETDVLNFHDNERRNNSVPDDGERKMIKEDDEKTINKFSERLFNNITFAFGSSGVITDEEHALKVFRDKHSEIEEKSKEYLDEKFKEFEENSLKDLTENKNKIEEEIMSKLNKIKAIEFTEYDIEDNPEIKDLNKEIKDLTENKNKIEEEINKMNEQIKNLWEKEKKNSVEIKTNLEKFEKEKNETQRKIELIIEVLKKLNEEGKKLKEDIKKIKEGSKSEELTELKRYVFMHEDIDIIEKHSDKNDLFKNLVLYQQAIYTENYESLKDNLKLTGDNEISREIFYKRFNLNNKNIFDNKKEGSITHNIKNFIQEYSGMTFISGYYIYKLSQNLIDNEKDILGGMDKLSFIKNKKELVNIGAGLYTLMSADVDEKKFIYPQLKNYFDKVRNQINNYSSGLDGIYFNLGTDVLSNAKGTLEGIMELYDNLDDKKIKLSSSMNIKVYEQPDTKYFIKKNGDKIIEPDEKTRKDLNYHLNDKITPYEMYFNMFKNTDEMFYGYSGIIFGNEIPNYTFISEKFKELHFMVNNIKKKDSRLESQYEHFHRLITKINLTLEPNPKLPSLNPK